MCNKTIKQAAKKYNLDEEIVEKQYKLIVAQCSSEDGIKGFYQELRRLSNQNKKE